MSLEFVNGAYNFLNSIFNLLSPENKEYRIILAYNNNYYN